MPTMPSVEVTAPALVPYRYGIASVAPAVPPGADRWTAGVWWRTVACGQPVGVTEGTCTVDSPPAPLTVNVTPCVITEAAAFTVYARSDAGLGGDGGDVDVKRARARDILIAGEQFAVEKQLWTLLLAATPSEVVVADVADAVAQLEHLAVGAYAGQLTLHMSRYSATRAKQAGVIERSGDRLTTVLDSQVVAGGGYARADGGDISVIATGQPVVIRGDIVDVGMHVDVLHNVIDAVVERTYVVGWDCTAVRAVVPAAA